LTFLVVAVKQLISVAVVFDCLIFLAVAGYADCLIFLAPFVAADWLTLLVVADDCLTLLAVDVDHFNFLPLMLTVCYYLLAVA